MLRLAIAGMVCVSVITGAVMDKDKSEIDKIESVSDYQVVKTEYSISDEAELHFFNEYDEMIYKAFKDTKVDPYLAISISRLETGHYTSDAFVNGYNFGGITTNEGVKRYDSLLEGLETYVSLLEWYVESGMDTAEKMKSTYCPPNENWDDIVNDIYDKIVREIGGLN